MIPTDWLTYLPHAALLCTAELVVIAQSNALFDQFGGQSVIGANFAKFAAGDARIVQAAKQALSTLQLHSVHDLVLQIDRRRVVHVQLQALASLPEPVLYIELQLDRSAQAAPHALVRQLVRSFAHEVRNPLSGLRGTAQLLVKKHPELQTYTDVLINESDRIRRLVDQLSGAPAQPHVPVNIHLALEQARRLCAAQYAAIDWQRDYDPSLPAISASADAIAQAVINLLQNAAQAGATVVRIATRAEHQVRINSRLFRSAIRIDVFDNGEGVPEHLRDSLFLPLVSAKTDRGGSGFGLAIVLAVAEEHAGSVRYRSTKSDTCFSLYFPFETP
jgi:nitrogen-specific signal transduction histidine kinase